MKISDLNFWLSVAAGFIVLASPVCIIAQSPSPASDASSAGVSCRLTPEQLQKRRQELLPGLFKRAQEITDLPTGLRLRFDPKAGLLAELARIIEQEEDCCSFLRFQISVEPNAGDVTLEVTGPAGTREMLRAL